MKMSYKGKIKYDVGAFYAPYIPVMSNPLWLRHGLETFNFGKRRVKFNDTGILIFFDTILVREFCSVTRRMYGYFEDPFICKFTNNELDDLQTMVYNHQKPPQL